HEADSVVPAHAELIRRGAAPDYIHHCGRLAWRRLAVRDLWIDPRYWTGVSSGSPAQSEDHPVRRMVEGVDRRLWLRHGDGLILCHAILCVLFAAAFQPHDPLGAVYRARRPLTR